jgi:hypothetical protein
MQAIHRQATLMRRWALNPKMKTILQQQEMEYISFLSLFFEMLIFEILFN